MDFTKNVFAYEICGFFFISVIQIMINSHRRQIAIKCIPAKCFLPISKKYSKVQYIIKNRNLIGENTFFLNDLIKKGDGLE